jgi:FolB domain-containing protein
MDQIAIHDLSVFYHVGLHPQERANPQRLTVTVEMEHDLTLVKDDLAKTIDYQAVTQRLLEFGKGRSWKLIETVALEAAEMILRDFKPVRVTVEVKKFVVPQARDVSARVTRPVGAGDVK